MILKGKTEVLRKKTLNVFQKSHMGEICGGRSDTGTGMSLRRVTCADVSVRTFLDQNVFYVY
jgi:hypothetical protein